MLKTGLSVLIMAASASGLAASSPAEDGARLMAQMKVAMGGPALDAPAGFHETGTGTRDGAAMSYETWGDLKSLRSASTHSLGGHSMSGGFDGKVAWSTDPQGVTRIDNSADGLASARLGTYLTIGAYFYPDRFPARFEYRGKKQADGKPFDVVSVTPEGSVPLDLWLDPATHRLQRISGTDGKVTFDGVVQRYQVVDGAWIGFSLVETEGPHRTVLNLASYVFGDIPQERFSPPQQH